jgi:hypothetical protein
MITYLYTALALVCLTVPLALGFAEPFASDYAAWRDLCITGLLLAPMFICMAIADAESD